jgi:predicted heme/steroid binding protein
MFKRIAVICLSVMAITSVIKAQDAEPAASAQEEKTVIAAPAATEAAAPAEATFTLQQLATYNGKDGKPAYIAVDGIVYDVTDVKAWRKGEHNGGKAGTDISVKINRAPHKRKVIEKLKKIGVLIKGQVH